MLQPGIIRECGIENAVSGKIVSCNAVSENIANDSVKLEKV